MKMFVFILFVLEICVGHLRWASRYMGIEGNANAIYDFPKICNFALFVLCIQPSKKINHKLGMRMFTKLAP